MKRYWHATRRAGPTLLRRALLFERTGTPVSSTTSMLQEGARCMRPMEAKGCESCRQDTPVVAEAFADWSRRPTLRSFLAPRLAHRAADGCKAMQDVAQNRARHERLEPLQGVPRFHGGFRGLAGDQTVTTLQSEARSFSTAPEGSPLSSTIGKAAKRILSMVNMVCEIAGGF